MTSHNLSILLLNTCQVVGTQKKNSVTTTTSYYYFLLKIKLPSYLPQRIMRANHITPTSTQCPVRIKYLSSSSYSSSHYPFIKGYFFCIIHIVTNKCCSKHKLHCFLQFRFVFNQGKGHMNIVRANLWGKNRCVIVLTTENNFERKVVRIATIEI